MTKKTPQTKKYQFRDYHSVDFETCLAIFDSNVPDYFHVTERRDFEDFLLDLPGPYLILEETDNGVVACGGYAFIPETHSADLCWGMTDSAFHKQGYGKLLLNERLDRITANPAITDIQLTTSQHTEAFFIKAGFSTTDMQQNGFAPGLHQYQMSLKV